MSASSVLKVTHNGKEWCVFLRTTEGPSHAECPEWRDRAARTKRTESAPMFTAPTADECFAWCRANQHLNTYKP